MRLEWKIAVRYLFSRKKQNAVNIVSAISIGGVALATMAMVCVLSGFNGFRELVGSLYTNFDPTLMVRPAQGKLIDASDKALAQIKADGSVEAASEVLEDHALILFRGRPVVIRLKGVDANFERTSEIKSILFGEGDFTLTRANLHYGVPGYGLAAQMGGVDFGQLQICVPRRGERINLANPIENINADDLMASGSGFQVHQNRYDNDLMLCDLAFAQNLFEQPGKISQLEVRLKPGANEQAAKQRFREASGGRLLVLDRNEQHEETYHVMALEKAFSFFFLAFIVLVASFNIIGCVSMIIIEKRSDAHTLSHLGADASQVVRIFLYEGRLIALCGSLLGIALGVGLCLLQQHYGLLRLGDGSANFIINAYPVSISPLDLLLVFVTVNLIGFVAVWYPVRYLSRRFL